MGQGYLAIILAGEKDDGKEIIRTWVNPHNLGNGYKLIEHSYIGNQFVEAVEYLISPLGMFYKSRVVWAGDYADEETCGKNLHSLAFDDNETKELIPKRIDMSQYRYVINHTRKLYVDKNIESGKGYNIHPLSLLTAEGNGRGGGDYSGSNEELVGTWSRDMLSIDKEIPADYKELVCDFGLP